MRVLKCSFVCDEQCLSYKSMKICSHSVAIAIKLECVDNLLKSCRTMKCTPNFTALAEAGKPSTTGKKSVRKGVSKKCSQEIKRFVTDAEEAGLQWNLRGEPQPTTTATDEPSHSQGPSLSLQRDQQVSTSACPTTTLFMSHRDVQNIHIGSISSVNHPVTRPPPLIQTGPDKLYHSPSSTVSQGILSSVPVSVRSQEQRPCVETPFWVVFIFGNISRCNGCKGRISRDHDKKVLPPPDDIVFGHKDHPWKTCIAPHFSDFDPNRHIVVQDAVKEKLLHVHGQFLFSEFGVFM